MEDVIKDAFNTFSEWTLTEYTFLNALLNAMIKKIGDTIQVM
jgi:hypothetical protein